MSDEHNERRELDLHIIIAGKPGMGKSTLAARIARIIDDEAPEARVRIDDDDMPTAQVIAECSTRKMSPTLRTVFIQVATTAKDARVAEGQPKRGQLGAKSQGE